MAFTFVAMTGADTGDPDPSGTPGTTLDADASLNVQAGDLLICWAKWELAQGATLSMAKDTGSPANAFTFDAANRANHGNGELSSAFGYKVAASADATATFRLTHSATASYRRFFVLQFRPDSGDTVTKDGNGAIATGSSTAPNSGNITTTGTDEVVVGGYGEYSALTTSSELINGVSATEPTGSPRANSSVWYRILTATFTGGAASATLSGSQDWVCGAIAFKAVAGGASNTLTADPGSYSLTGTAATLTRRYTLACASGSYALTGTAMVPEHVRVLASSDGSYVLTGTAATLTVIRRVALAPGSYTLTGTDASLTLDPGTGGNVYTLTADPGSYALNGTAAALRYTRTMPAAAGSYALTGTDAVPRRTRVMAAAAGSYSQTGTALALRLVWHIIAAAGSYSISAPALRFTLNGEPVGPARGGTHSGRRSRRRR